MSYLAVILPFNPVKFKIPKSLQYERQQFAESHSRVGEIRAGSDRLRYEGKLGKN
jgi:hypothetical protein